MSHLHSYLATAKKILEKYYGEVPFNIFLKKFYSEEKKYGSRDRKTIANLCYNYFRISSSLQGKSTEDKLLTGLFLFTYSPNEILEKHFPEWNKDIDLPTLQKASMAGLDVNKLFPFNAELSGNIDSISFNHSLLIQPDLFIRIRPGKNISVKEKLALTGIAYKEIGSNCLSLANGTKLENILDVNNDALIQDWSSQRVSEMFELINLPAKPLLWDCCAASGGKAIMAHDMLPGISITVSDIRPSIINNLQKRFSEAKITKYKSLVTDVSNSAKLKQDMAFQKFDIIICDVPCSGSGTWNRTPEQFSFFKEEAISRYSNLQKLITSNTIAYLSSKGYLLYITCSVFGKENEDVVKSILQNSKMKLIKQELITGYNAKADTMFAALFQLTD